MRFSKLIIENFGAIGKVEIDLADRGLILICGENRDDSSANSNGAAKTTVLDALCWCLYGVTAKGQTGDSVINRTVGKNTRVQVQVIDEDQVYWITRYRKFQKLGNGLDVQQVEPVANNLTKGTIALTQATVNDIVGASLEVFSAAIYAAQEKMPDLPSMTDRNLKLLVEEASGITALEAAYEIAGKRHTDAKNAHDAAQLACTVADRTLSAVFQRIADAREAHDIWEGERTARMMDRQAEARNKLQTVKDYDAELAKAGDPETLKQELAGYKAKLGNIKGEQDELDKLEARLRSEEANAAKQNATAESCGLRLKEARAKKVQVEGGIGKPCDECGRLHDADTLHEAITGADVMLGRRAREAREALAAAKSALGSCQQARERVSQHRASMTDASELVRLSDVLTKRLANIADMQRRREDAVADTKRQVDAMKAEKAAINPHAKQIVALEAEAEKLKLGRQALDAQVDEAYETLCVAKSVMTVFGPKGVRAHILDTVTPYLNERTAHYLGMLADGNIRATWQTLSLTAKGEVREKFAVNVELDTGGTFVDLSGGEKRKVRLACAMALQDLVATRASKPIDFWSADEIDQALDTSGQERLMMVLNEKARDRGTAFVISHNDMKSWFRGSITIIKENGLASLAA